MPTPNIFYYATKELSQDAVICWLVSCASEATGSLRECGLAFVRTLFQAGGDEMGGVPVLGPDGEKTFSSRTKPTRVPTATSWRGIWIRSGQMRNRRT